MKTEFDNTENEALSIARIKSRFFAQYWGVKCFEWKPENSIGVQNGGKQKVYKVKLMEYQQKMQA